jgi:hypothetical protein
MALLKASRQGVGTDDDGLDRQIGATKNFADPVQAATGEPTDHEEIDVASLVLVAARE